MAVQSLTLNNIFKSRIHGPSLKGKPFYVQKADYKDSENTSDGDLASLLKNPEYMKHANSNLNSPTNIRRIFITHKKVVIEHYAAPMINGKRDNLVIERTVQDFDSWVKKWINSNLISPSQAAFSKSSIDKVKITGNISQPIEFYKCSNIEEIYFDWSALVSDDLGGFINSKYNNGQVDNIHPYIIQNYMNKQKNLGTKNQNEAMMLLLINKQKLTYSYKRLRMVGFISNLDDIDIKGTIETINSNKVSDTSRLWVENEVVMNYIKSGIADVWLTKIDGAVKTYDRLENFEIKKAQFKFDDEYLEKKLKSYVNKVNDIKIDNGYTAQKAKEAQKINELDNMVAEEGSLDELILHIRKNHDAKFVQKVLRVAARSIDSQSLGAALASMNPEVKNYTKSLIQ